MEGAYVPLPGQDVERVSAAPHIWLPPEQARDEIDHALTAIVYLHASIGDARGNNVSIMFEDFAALLSDLSAYMKAGIYPHL